MSDKLIFEYVLPFFILIIGTVLILYLLTRIRTIKNFIVEFIVAIIEVVNEKIEQGNKRRRRRRRRRRRSRSRVD